MIGTMRILAKEIVAGRGIQLISYRDLAAK
jgi:hypothetical protein